MARVEADAPAFCGAIARMCGLALSNLQREVLHQRQRQLEADLTTARDAQRRMMPPESGAVGPIRYAMRSVPGRVVAGDLFDLFPLDDRRIAVCLGDVTGKGMGSAMLMAMTQSFLRASLTRDSDLGRAMASLNEYLHAHSASHEFVSMFAAVIDTDARTISFVDAGHGYAILRPPADSPAAVAGEGSMLLGVQAGTDFTVEPLPFQPGSRLVIVSDGVIEQQAPDALESSDGAPADRPAGQFGVHRCLEILHQSPTHEDDVAALLQHLLDFAQTTALSDDVTIVSLALA
jgi:serine phosphatase RsbU (regulator of sigma subunit)